MHASDSRILTTHVGSLPRSPALAELLIDQEQGRAIDRAELERQTERAVWSVMQKQAEAGVDIVNDGEQPRVGFQTYVPQRMTGFGGESRRPTPRDMKAFPDFAALLQQRTAAVRAKMFNAPQWIAVPKVKEGTTVQRTPIIGRDERRVKEAQQTVHALFYSPNHALISVAYLKRGMEGARHVAPR